jgi:hypothetical protein
MLRPWRKPTELPVVTVVGEPHLGTNEEDATVVNDDSAVVDDVLVGDGPAKRAAAGEDQRQRIARYGTRGATSSHADVYHHILCFLGLDDLG